MKYVICILLLFIISKAYSSPVRMDFDRNLKHNAACIMENDQIGNFIYSAYIDDDSEASDGLDYSLGSAVDQNFFVKVAEKTAYITPVPTQHTISFITPLFIDLPPPSAAIGF